MKVSIVTICFNPGESLAMAVESVLGQDYSDIEYIIVDGGSTDGSAEYVRSLNGRVAAFVSEPDDGIYDALNKGVSMASGDIIGFVHADDMFAGPGVVSRVIRGFEESGADAIYGDLDFVSKDDVGNVVRRWRSGAYRPGRLRFGWMPPHPTLFVRREVYEKAKLPSGEYFDTSFRIAGDYDFMLRILGGLGISLAHVPEVLIKMRMGGASTRSIGNIVAKSKEDYVIIRRNKIGGLGTLMAKNLRKLPQLFKRA
jgi:glycosyltransferase involved in cell wall biosynthesis